MAVLAWAMMGLAIWHFTVWLPDRFWGGIVGALIGALCGSVLVGFLINGVSLPGASDTHLLTAVDGIPGALLGIAVMYVEGVRRERQAGGPVSADVAARAR